MSNEAINWARLKPCQNPTTKLVLFLLCNYADRNCSCYPSERHLAVICGVSERSVRRSIKNLSEIGLISIKRRLGMTNIYTLSMAPSLDTSVRRVRPPVDGNTSNKQPRRRTINDIAG